MSLVNMIELMSFAKKHNYAIPAFNVDNLESVIAIAKASAKLSSPVIFQTIPKTLNYGGINTYPALINAVMSDFSVDYAIHLDHGNSNTLAQKCINAGFSSVMFDGSALPFLENATQTFNVAENSHTQNIPVEGELGVIGGKEQSDNESTVKYTEVFEAEKFVELTKVDALAIAVGTSHGVYKGVPCINTTRISQISQAIPTLLVLHGASGLSNEVVSECIKCGISKINFATEIRQAFTCAIRKALEKDSDVFDPKLYLPFAIENMENVALAKIKLCYGR